MLSLTLRNLLARKVRLLMSTLAIVLGIGFLAGVMTFSSGLNKTFDNILEGSTSDAMVRPSGDLQASNAGVSTDQVVTPADVEKLRALPEVKQAEGSVDGIGSFLLGKDDKLVGGQGAPTLAFNYAPGENMAGEQILELSDGRWPEKPGEVTLDTSSAERGAYDVGDTVTLIVPTGKEPERKFTLVGTADFNGGGTAGATLVLLDTAEAQDIFLDGQDAFTSVSLTGADGVSQQELADAAKAVVPAGFTAVTGDKVVKETQDQIGQFLDVISYFLVAFAVIAIVVGAFIIFNTFSILVSQRVRESALLRALGASKRQVTRSVLVEAFLMALVGSTLGLLLGLGLSRLLAGLFRSFGLDIAGEVLTLTTGTVVAGYAVGIVVTMLAAFVPARRAAKVPPVAAMRDDLVVQEKGMTRRLVLGTVAMAIGTALAAAGLAGAPGTDAIWIGAGAVIWVVTTAVLAPVLGHPVLVVCRAVFGRLFRTPGRLAGENALRNPRRTGATASALMIGLAVVSAVGVLAASLGATQDKIVDDEFTADFLVQMPTFQGFPARYGDQMEEVNGVDLVSRQQGTPVNVDVKGQAKPEQTFASAVDAAFFEIYDLKLVDGETAASGDRVMLSEDRSKDLDAGVGDTIKVDFPGGKTIPLTVSGVFESTPTTSGITMPLSVLREAGIKRSDSSLSITLADGADRSSVRSDLDFIVKDLPILSVQDKEEFKDLISGQVNQLLYVIYGLLALAVVIAVIGIVNTLGLSVIERTREIGLLRAIGLSRRKLRWMITLESVAIALLGAVLGMVLGLVIGVVLRQSLKDDLTELALPLSSLVAFLVVAVLFGVLAAVVPAIRASRMKVLEAIATE
ncbi:putative ABC transport system permease protein [Nocardioides sp. BE266]|uniref:ABC transporter permease n=1 Tax=Nocardioides sp. BE266 TaxID=2817725 RepID=UPI0028563D19|nr:ABC transporter permease [Nocardioides sp. BE266]MDR7253147.1 putative ABC transport system permease protein [Nocardioides sp. BE266]